MLLQIASSGLFNTSGRALVGSGDDILSVEYYRRQWDNGFVVTAKGLSSIVVVPGDPTLSLYDASGTSIAFNDDGRMT